MKYSFYPGCSLERNANAYLTSTLAIAKHLDIGLVEIEDWNCCGATEYVSLNKTASFALIARNLASKNEGLKEIIAPCSACYINLCKADKYLQEDARLRQDVSTALAAGGLAYTPGSLKARHLLDVVVVVREQAVHVELALGVQALLVLDRLTAAQATPDMRAGQARRGG